MTDSDKILSRGEVDALLSAIGSGEVEDAEGGSDASLASPYDFKRPPRLPRDLIRAIETLHETYSRGLQGSLSGLLRRDVDVRLVRVDQLSYEEFIQSLPNPTVLAVYSCEPLHGSLLLEFNPSIAFPVIERLLGSRSQGGGQPERALTRVEWNLIEGVLARAVDPLQMAWAPVAPVTFKAAARGSDPPVLRVLSPNEAMVSVTLEIGLGEHRGHLNLAFPVTLIAEHREKLAARAWRETPKQAAPPALAERTLSVHLPVESMALKDLRTLRPGHLLVTNHHHSGEVLLSVDDRPRYLGKLGSLKDHRACKVIGPAPGVVEEGGVPPRIEVKARPGEGSGPMRMEDLLRIPITESVVVAERSMAVRDLLNVKVGDVVTFPRRFDEPLELRVGGRTVAEGTAVTIGDTFGLQVSANRDAGEKVAERGS